MVSPVTFLFSNFVIKTITSIIVIPLLSPENDGNIICAVCKLSDFGCADDLLLCKDPNKSSERQRKCVLILHLTCDHLIKFNCSKNSAYLLQPTILPELVHILSCVLHFGVIKHIQIQSSLFSNRTNLFSFLFAPVHRSIFNMHQRRLGPCDPTPTLYYLFDQLWSMNLCNSRFSYYLLIRLAYI